MFDPTKFNFILSHGETWISNPTIEGLIGKYELKHDRGWFDLYEIYIHNNECRPRMIYTGQIPTDDFAFDLFTNMNLELPVIRRHSKINFLIQ